MKLAHVGFWRSSAFESKRSQPPNPSQHCHNSCCPAPAGLSAIGTAKNMGAIVRVFDTRAAVAEQVGQLALAQPGPLVAATAGQALAAEFPTTPALAIEPFPLLSCHRRPSRWAPSS